MQSATLINFGSEFLKQVFNNDISYVLIDTQNYELSCYALETSQARFPLQHTLIFSDREDCWNDRPVCRIPKMQSLEDYNRCIFYLKNTR